MPNKKNNADGKHNNEVGYLTNLKAKQVDYCLCYLHSKFGADRSTASGDNDSFFAEGQVTKSKNTTSANFV